MTFLSFKKALLLATLLFSLICLPVVKASDEFQVNTYTLGNQERPSVGVSTTGSFVIVWTSSGTEDIEHEGVFAQRYDAGGKPVGSEIHVSNSCYEYCTPSVGVAPDGSFVIAWFVNPTGGVVDILIKRYDSEGHELTVSVSSSSGIGSVFHNASHPSIGITSEGGFVIVWMTQDNQDIIAWHFDSSGKPVGHYSQVCRWGQVPKIAVASDGSFVVTWQSNLVEYDGSWGVLARRYDPNGNPIGGTFLVNTYKDQWQGSPSIGIAHDGSFVIVWCSWLQDGDKEGIYAQRYDPSGNPVGKEFRVNTLTTGDQSDPSVAVAPDGGFIIAWASGDDISAQRYDASGGPVGNEFRVNKFVSGEQRKPSIGVFPDDSFIVAWDSNGQDGDGYGIFANIFPALPSAGEEEIKEDWVAKNLTTLLAVATLASIVAIVLYKKMRRKPGPKIRIKEAGTTRKTKIVGFLKRTLIGTVICLGVAVLSYIGMVIVLSEGYLISYFLRDPAGTLFLIFRPENFFSLAWRGYFFLTSNIAILMLNLLPLIIGGLISGFFAKEYRSSFSSALISSVIYFVSSSVLTYFAYSYLYQFLTNFSLIFGAFSSSSLVGAKLSKRRQKAVNETPPHGVAASSA